MKSIIQKHSISAVVCIVMWFGCFPIVSAQTVMQYGPEHPTASVHHDEILYGTYKSLYDKFPDYPVRGAYSPTIYSNLTRTREYNKSIGLPYGVGVCNYIYIPTDYSLLPGHQYRIRLTVKMTDAFGQMPYFRAHFGIALTRELYAKEYWGLWIEHFAHLKVETTKEPVTMEFIFRPLCSSQYLLLGVFQGAENDPQTLHGFLTQYYFELHDLIVEVWNDPNAEFVYLCDAYEESRIKKKSALPQDTDTVFFESGSAEIPEAYIPILDSIPSKLSNKQSLITLCAYTDNEGSDNEELGKARNMAVRKALSERSIDTARIMLINYGESKASKRISPEDRRVEIRVNTAMLFQKYYTEAMRAATAGVYSVALDKMKNWIRLVPPDYAIHALFDCWGESEKAILFKHDLVGIIRSKHYKGDDLKFTLDSLHCEDQLDAGEPGYSRTNSLPDSQKLCDYIPNVLLDSLRDAAMLRKVDTLYAKYGFPTIEDVGKRGHQTLPLLIIHAGDTTFQKRYLPLMQKACEEQRMSWDYYALLYDKIGLTRNGRQRYGTQMMKNDDGSFTGRHYPFEDETMISEYRKQVGLAPLSDY